MRAHTEEKPHHCIQCNKALHQDICLTRHMSTHTGDKPYQCNQCDMCFKPKKIDVFLVIQLCVAQWDQA